MSGLLGMMLVTVAIIAVIIVGTSLYIVHYLLIKLPEKQKNILEHFSPQVIDQVSLEYASLPQYQQRQIAEEKMREIFRDQKITAPGDAMIETSIASAIYKRKTKEANLWIEELKTDQLSQADTSEMPVTPKEEQWIL